MKHSTWQMKFFLLWTGRRAKNGFKIRLHQILQKNNLEPRERPVSHWHIKMNIGNYSYKEYEQLVASFHGKMVPGLIIGGFIVDMALQNLPEGESFASICETMAKPMGTIIMAVAVLDIHMDKNAAAAMNPSTILEGPPPMRRMIKSAMRRCNCHFSMVKAIIKPPMNRKIVLLK